MDDILTFKEGLNLYGYIINIEGRVQGVGYRYFCKKRADELNLTGFVKNLPDGSVYLEVFGIETFIEIFLENLRKGSIRSSVEKVHIIQCPYNEYDRFSIR
jgi:acylphosphatase